MLDPRWHRADFIAQRTFLLQALFAYGDAAVAADLDESAYVE